MQHRYHSEKVSLFLIVKAASNTNTMAGTEVSQRLIPAISDT
ncbi:hypothetical protein [Budvicia aquatica]|nr:hypothetical protein [Budvicia aquatica]